MNILQLGRGLKAGLDLQRSEASVSRGWQGFVTASEA